MRLIQSDLSVREFLSKVNLPVILLILDTQQYFQ
jgi:hypothetical protein